MGRSHLPARPAALPLVVQPFQGSRMMAESAAAGGAMMWDYSGLGWGLPGFKMLNTERPSIL